MIPAGPLHGSRPWTGILWLAGAALVLTLSNGRWHIALAAWLAPFCLRMFLMTQPLARGLLVGLSVQLLAYTAQWTEIIPAPGLLYVVIAGTYALVYFLPFAIDRVVAPRLGAFTSTLVLPSAWFLAESLVERWTPYGSWAALGYTQMDHLPLTQLAALTGVAGIGFAITWTAAVVSALLLDDPERRKRSLLTIWATVAMVVLLVGEFRLARVSPATEQVRMALLTPSVALTAEFERAMRNLDDSESSNPAAVLDLARRLNEDLLQRSRLEARAGARIVVWSEHAARVVKEEETAWLGQARALAREEGIYLFMGLGTWRRHQTPPFENKVVAITADGEVAWQHQKARPIIGTESGIILPGHDVLPVLDSPFGRLAAVICHENLDFPGFVRQAGRKDVDVLFAPSADWSAIEVLHAEMARARAIENGLTLVRPTSGGLSIVVDPVGRVVSAAADRGREEGTLVSSVPVGRIAAIYPSVRDLLLWLDVAALTVLLIMAVRIGPVRRGVFPTPDSVTDSRPSVKGASS